MDLQDTPEQMSFPINGLPYTDLSFSCDGRAYGYYADPATNCQVFHICLGEQDIKWSFLCPNQTIFNQVKFMTFIITNKWSDIVFERAGFAV